MPLVYYNYKEIKVTVFLNKISVLESTGGKFTKHRKITNGIHSGDRAIGKFGLMPNTIRELTLRRLRDGETVSYLYKVKNMNNTEIHNFIERNQHIENAYASYLAKFLFKKFDNESKIAYTWLYGHNLTNTQIKSRDYLNDEYVKKFRSLQ